MPRKAHDRAERFPALGPSGARLAAGERPGARRCSAEWGSLSVFAGDCRLDFLSCLFVLGTRKPRFLIKRSYFLETLLV